VNLFRLSNIMIGTGSESKQQDTCLAGYWGDIGQSKFFI